MEVANDAVSGSVHIAQRVHPHMGPVVRSTAQALGDTFQTGANAVAATTGGAVQSTRRRVSNVIEEQVTMRVKRIWHLLLMSILLCFVIPMLVLRPYHPLNTYVANL